MPRIENNEQRDKVLTQISVLEQNKLWQEDQDRLDYLNALVDEYDARVVRENTVHRRMMFNLLERADEVIDTLVKKDIELGESGDCGYYDARQCDYIKSAMELLEDIHKVIGDE